MEWYRYLLEQLPPPYRPWVSVAIFGLLLVLVVVIIIRLARGANVSFFGIASLRNDDSKAADLKMKYSALRTEFNSLNEDSKQKSNVLTLLEGILNEISQLLWGIGPSTPPVQRIDMIYYEVLEAADTSLSTGKGNMNRIAVLIPDHASQALRIRYGRGFDSHYMESRRLSLADTFAGRVFTTGRQEHSPNVQKSKYYTPNPESTYEYRSLACTPILCGNTCTGVLSIDAQEENSFTRQDLNFMRLFAEVLSTLHFVSEYYANIEQAIEEEDGHREAFGEESV